MDTGRDDAWGRGHGDEPARPSLEKRTSGDADASGGPVAPVAPVGPGETVASNDAPGWAAPSVHDQQTVTSVPSAGTPSAAMPPQAMPDAMAPPPWANPSANVTPPASANASAAAPFAPPSPAPPANGSAANPFAPPSAPYAQGEPVPPPPIAPDGPGQMQYGYPGYTGYPGHSGHSGYPGYGHAPDGGYGWPGLQPMPSNGLGTAGLVLGIISAAVFCLWPVAIIVGVLALIFGMIGRGKARRGEATNAGQALAGIICGAAGVVFGFVMLAFVIATR